MKQIRNFTLSAIASVLAGFSAPACAQIAPLMPATTLTGTGYSPAFYVPKDGNAAVFLKGGTATLQMEASPDNGTTWYPAYAAGSNQIYVYNMSGQNMFDTMSGVTGGVLYHFNVTSWTSNVVVTVLGGAQ